MRKPKTNPRFEIFKEMPLWSLPSCLYIAGAGMLTKVGYTQSLLTRSKALMADLERRSNSPFHGIVAFPGAGGFQEEKGLIELMKSRFEVAYGNEYFKCHFDDAYELVAEYCVEVRYKYLDLEEGRAAKRIESLKHEISRIEDHMRSHRNYVSNNFAYRAFENPTKENSQHMHQETKEQKK